MHAALLTEQSPPQSASDQCGESATIRVGQHDDERDELLLKNTGIQRRKTMLFVDAEMVALDLDTNVVSRAPGNGNSNIFIPVVDVRPRNLEVDF